MTAKTGKDLLPHLFKTRGVPTKSDPALAISEVKCPSCGKTRIWRIVATRTLKTSGDIKRNVICLGCGWGGAFMERQIDGEQKIVLAPNENEASLLEQIDDLRTTIEGNKPKLAIFSEIWELVEPGNRNTPLDELVDLFRARIGAGEVSADDDTWAPVRAILGGVLDEAKPATPESIAEAIDQIKTTSRVDLERAQAEAKDHYEGKVALTRHLETAGAKKVGDGWAWPYYEADGGVKEYLSPTEWVKRRQAAAKLIQDQAADIEGLSSKVEALLKDYQRKTDDLNQLREDLVDAKKTIATLTEERDDLMAKTVTDKLPKASSNGQTKKKSGGKKKASTKKKSASKKKQIAKAKS